MTLCDVPYSPVLAITTVPAYHTGRPGSAYTANNVMVEWPPTHSFWKVFKCTSLCLHTNLMMIDTTIWKNWPTHETTQIHGLPRCRQLKHRLCVSALKQSKNTNSKRIASEAITWLLFVVHGHRESPLQLTAAKPTLRVLKRAQSTRGSHTHIAHFSKSFKKQWSQNYRESYEKTSSRYLSFLCCYRKNGAISKK